MANLYKEVIVELSNHSDVSLINNSITAPYEPVQDYQTQIVITYQLLLQSNRTGNQKVLL
ncbi:17612_t:CDS:1, partial [Cetraspora pellucida]